MIRYTLVGIITVLFFVGLLWLRSETKSEVTSAVITDGDFTYRLHEPDNIASLSKKLDEVSGLAYGEARTLAMINDEEGLIFLWDTRSAKIIEEIDFGKDGDYEGIAVEGLTAYVLRSDGDVYQVANFRTSPQTKKYENPLDDDNDTEGLAYNPTNKNLLIACKATGRIKYQPDSEKVLVYQFSPDSPDELVPWLTADDISLRPSGIALHPQTSHYYLLSSPDRQLAVFGSDHTLLQQIDLPKKLFPQPEGICFSPAGTLYIANEKGKDRATLLQFNPQPTRRQP